jgi:SAM-dependent methyltransferase
MQPRAEWLARCPACGFLASSLEPGPGTGLEGLEDLRRANFEVILDRIARHMKLDGARVLDIGCAKGWFLAGARARGALVHGIEPQEPHVLDARAAGIAVEHGFFPDDLADQGPYGIVTFHDVFEHLPSPQQAIVDVAGRLEPGGLVVINLPSSRGVLYRIATALNTLGMPGAFERLWQKGLPSPHMSYFDPDNLRALVERHTSLRQIDSFALPSFRRARLWQRIEVTHSGPAALAIYGGLWVLSFLLPLLPADIHVGVFRKAG